MNKDKFLVYENIRQSGLTNMFAINMVIELSCDNLTKEDCLNIMENYHVYSKRWLE